MGWKECWKSVAQSFKWSQIIISNNRQPHFIHMNHSEFQKLCWLISTTFSNKHFQYGTKNLWILHSKRQLLEITGDFINLPVIFQKSSVIKTAKEWFCEITNDCQKSPVILWNILKFLNIASRSQKITGDFLEIDRYYLYFY